MIALSPQVMPITCKHSLDGGLCTCFSTMQTIIRQLYTQITSSIRGYLSSLKMLHSVPQQPFGNRNQTWDLWLQKCKYSPLVTAVEMFSASHYNWANTRRSPVPQLFIMTMNMGRKLFCPQKLARNKALWVTRQVSGRAIGPRCSLGCASPGNKSWHFHLQSLLREHAGCLGVLDITILPGLTGAACPSPLGSKNVSCPFWFLLSSNLRPRDLIQGQRKQALCTEQMCCWWKCKPCLLGKMKITY